MTETEAVLIDIASALLEEPSVDLDADLVSLGLDSLQAIHAAVAAEQRLGITVSAELFARDRSLRSIAAAIDATRDAPA